LTEAKSMLDNEYSLRKKAERERDGLRSQLQLLREFFQDDHLVDEVKLNRLKDFREDHFRFTGEDLYSSPLKATPKGILKNLNKTEETVKDVDEFSFDETRDLCESRSRLGRRSSSRKRSRSIPRDVLNENILDDIESPKEMHENKRKRRSRSIVAFQDCVEGYSSEEPELRPRALNHIQECPRPDLADESNSSSYKPAGHNFQQKGILMVVNCCVCSKRIKFGKIGMKCSLCRSQAHTECVGQVSILCPGRNSPVCDQPNGDRPFTRSSVVKQQYFSSPKIYT